MRWIGNYCFNIRCEWGIRPRSILGWMNRLLCVANLTLVHLRDSDTASWRLAVVRYQRFLSPEGMRDGQIARHV